MRFNLNSTKGVSKHIYSLSFHKQFLHYYMRNTVKHQIEGHVFSGVLGGVLELVGVTNGAEVVMGNNREGFVEKGTKFPNWYC